MADPVALGLVGFDGDDVGAEAGALHRDGPAAAPMSQMVRPSPGPSRASTSARTSALVIIESRCSNRPRAAPSGAGAARDGRPASAGRVRGPRIDRDRTSVRRMRDSASSRCRQVTRSAGVPSVSPTSMDASVRRGQQLAADFGGGPWRGQDRDLGWAAARRRPPGRGSRPWAVITRASSQSRPSRAKATPPRTCAGSTAGLMPAGAQAGRCRRSPGRPRPEPRHLAGLAAATMASSASSRRLSSEAFRAPPGIAAASSVPGAPTTRVAAARPAAASGSRGDARRTDHGDRSCGPAEALFVRPVKSTMMTWIYRAA